MQNTMKGSGTHHSNLGASLVAILCFNSLLLASCSVTEEQQYLAEERIAASRILFLDYSDRCHKANGLVVVSSSSGCFLVPRGGTYYSCTATIKRYD